MTFRPGARILSVAGLELAFSPIMPAVIRMSRASKDGEPIRYIGWPFTGKRPSKAHSNQDCIAPASVFCEIEDQHVLWHMKIEK